MGHDCMNPFTSLLQHVHRLLFDVSAPSVRTAAASGTKPDQSKDAGTSGAPPSVDAAARGDTGDLAEFADIAEIEVDAEAADASEIGTTAREGPSAASGAEIVTNGSAPRAAPDAADSAEPGLPQPANATVEIRPPPPPPPPPAPPLPPGRAPVDLAASAAMARDIRAASEEIPVTPPSGPPSAASLRKGAPGTTDQSSAAAQHSGPAEGGAPSEGTSDDEAVTGDFFASTRAKKRHRRQ
jgi:hypothetical protein